MGKTPERRVFTSSGPLRYRRKMPAPADNQQPEPPKDPKTQQEKLKAQDPKQPKNRSRSSRSPSARHFRPQPKQPKHNHNQPALLKQLLWKAKAVQPTPAALQQLQLQQQQSNNDKEDEDEEDEEEAFAAEQRHARKLLASKAEALAVSKNKAVTAPSVEPFVAESSSQETQSGSEDEAVFLPYGGLVPVQPPVETVKWQVYKHEADAEVSASPVMPAEAVETAKDQEKKDASEKAAATRRKQRQKYKLKQKQKRAAAKEQKRLQHQQKQMQEAADKRPRPTEDDAVSTPDDENAAVDIFHPPTNLASEMDAGVCRAVLTQLEDVVPFIVVGDVACPVVAESDDQPLEAAAASDMDQTANSEGAIVDFRQHVIAMLDRSKEMQMQYRDSFVVEDSRFDAASSYDFFKRRFCDVQRSAGIVYY